MESSFVPYVVEKKADGERSYDIYSRLLEDRIIFLGTDINSATANSVVAQLLLLDQKDPTRDIFLYINSPGGSITSGLAILDTMNYIRPDVHTVCIGEAASMGAVLLAAGAPGKRSSLPNAKIMIHQPRQRGAAETMTVTEQQIDLKVIKKMKIQLSQILAERTGQSLKKVLRDCENDKWFEPKEAKEYGLIDLIITKKPS